MLKRAKEAGYSNDHWPRQDPDLMCLHGDPVFDTLFPVLDQPS
jgi:hypothetical protein